MSTGISNIREMQFREVLLSKRILAGVVLFAALAVFPIAALILPVSEVFYTVLVIQIMSMAIVAIGFNIVLGYTGLLSFGHAAFFGIAMYAGVLTTQWIGIQSLLLMIITGIVAAAALGLIIGLISLRTHEIYFALLTLALAQIVWVVAHRDIGGVFGGSDGIGFDRPDLLGMGFTELAYAGYMMNFYYYAVLVFFALAILALWVVLRSPFGLTLKIIRENEDRAEMIGVPVYRYKVYSFILSAAFVGLGGALFSVTLGHLTPDYLYWTTSGEIVFMAILGGIGTFFGPVLGAAGFLLLEEFVLRVTQYWHFLMGIVLLGVVLLLREDGLYGGIKSLFDRFGGDSE